MRVDGPPQGSRLDGDIRLVIVKSPDLAAPLVGALAAADVGAWVWIEAERALYFSPRVLDLLGLNLADPQPLLFRFFHRIHPDDRTAMRMILDREYPAGPFVLRYRFAAPGGDYRWLENRGRVERADDGTLISQGGTICDVTSDVDQEQQRREATARLEALVNAIPFAVWGRSGSDLRVTHQNATSKEWWGDLSGRGMSDMPADAGRVWRAQIADALQGSVVRMRSTYRRDEGVRILDEYIAPVTIEDETVGVVGVGIDVTDEQRRRQFEELVTQLAGDFVSRTSDSLDEPITDALERIARFLGMPVAALCDVSDNALSVMHLFVDPGGDRKRPAQMRVDEAQARGLLDRLRNNRPVVASGMDDIPDGLMDKQWLTDLRLQSFAIVPARPDEEQLIALAIAGGKDQIVDWSPDTVPLLRLAATLLASVVARKRTDESRRRVNQRMQEAQKLESLGVLAGGIAHDFNNLLTAILGNASLARADLPEDAPLQEALEQIEAASRRAADLCRQMLAYAGRGRFALQTLDLNSVVRDAQPLINVSVPKKVKLDLRLSSALPNVLADHAQLRQVLMNLVINAGEAIGERDGAITITTAHRQASADELATTVFSPQLEPGPYVSVRVTDTGSGMPPEMISRIFDPFFSTKFTGRGLGLAAVVGIVRAHKGALRVESRPGEGSTFELLLPAHAGKAEEGADRLDVPDEATLARWRTTGTALIVDDESGVRQLLRALLQRAGMEVVVAEDGRAAVELFDTIAATVRIALIDLTMPGLDGREVLAHIRKSRPDLPAILMTGYTPADVGAAAAHGFLQKPFTPYSVRAAVWRALGG